MFGRSIKQFVPVKGLATEASRGEDREKIRQSITDIGRAVVLSENVRSSGPTALI
jgi:hypothetical protein